MSEKKKNILITISAVATSGTVGAGFAAGGAATGDVVVDSAIGAAGGIATGVGLSKKNKKK